MVKNLVSVIIATYNRENFLKETIDSVLAQTYKNFELIIIDDGSTDSTKKIVKSYNDSRIKYFYQKNSGQNSAKNNGLLAAKGKYITILDSDDVILPKKLELQVNALEKNHLSAVVYGGIILIDSNSNEIGKQKLKIHSGNVLKELLFTNFLYNGSNALFKRECIEKTGLFDESVKRMTDWDLYLRISLYFNFICIQADLLKYRVHNENMSCGYQKYEKNGKIILERIFSNPDFPKSLRRYKNKAYALRERYIARKYFDNSQYTTARKYFLKSMQTDWKLIFCTNILIFSVFTFLPIQFIKILKELNKIFWLNKGINYNRS